MDEQILAALGAVETQLSQALTLLRELAAIHTEALAGSVEEYDRKNTVVRGG